MQDYLELTRLNKKKSLSLGQFYQVIIRVWKLLLLVNLWIPHTKSPNCIKKVYIASIMYVSNLLHVSNES